MQCDRSHQLVELCLRERCRARLLGLRRRRDNSPKGDEPSEQPQVNSDARRHGTNSELLRRQKIGRVPGPRNQGYSRLHSGGVLVLLNEANDHQALRDGNTHRSRKAYAYAFALAGLLIALAGTIAADLLGWVAADAIASIAIGVVLALVATLMSLETKSLLIGEAASSEMVEGVRKLIEGEAAQGGAVRRVHAIRTMHLGPNDVLAAVRLGFDDGATAARVEHIVAGLERSIRQRYPDIRQLFLAPATTDQAGPS